MRKPALCIIVVAAAILSPLECMGSQAAAPQTPSSSAETVPRVRSEDPSITALIRQASRWSASFREFLDVIGRTDGLVYIERGRCPHGGAACMSHIVMLAGPYRMLRIVIDRSRADCDLDLMGSIGHELWHTIEILREPSIRSHAGVYHFYQRDGRRAGSIGAWETRAAIKAGVTVLNELKAAAPQHSCRK